MTTSRLTNGVAKTQPANAPERRAEVRMLIDFGLMCVEFLRSYSSVGDRRSGMRFLLRTVGLNY